MRVGIREQLAAVVLLVALVPIAVLSIAVWINSYAFIVGVTEQELSLTASLKASQIASDLLLLQATCATIVTRVVLQNGIKNFYRGNTTDANWTATLNDVGGALASGGYSSLIQTIVFSRNATGNPTGILKATANISAPGILLPNLYPNGTNAYLGDDSDLGYPTVLYPNITYTSLGVPDTMDTSINATLASAYNDFPLNKSSALVLGPLQINDSFALISLTLPIIDNSNRANVLAYMTVVAAASSLIDVMQSREGLAKTGTALLIGPSRHENIFKYAQRPAGPGFTPNPSDIGSAMVHYVFPPMSPTGISDRHKLYNQNISAYGSSNFTLQQFPAAKIGFGTQISAINNASSKLTTTNEQNVTVAVGYARPASTLVNWLLVVEQSHSEAWAPINKLRNIVLACVFGTFGAVLIVMLPMAHYSVRPIRRLRDATEKSISPPGYTPNGSIRSDRLDDMGDISGEEGGAELERRNSSQRPKKWNFIRLKRLSRGSRQKTKLERTEDERRRIFKIPGKVQDRKHFITDELTELTKTFNDMSDELMLQYTSLEEKVAERTRELEISKKAAEAANESKTLFIANISHELKTPLNGILGMCAVCMGEEDMASIKRSLQVVYKSGDLLLHLLNDLLTFSKNQIGQQLSLEEREFRLIDIRTQIVTIFMKQVQEGKINFSVKFLSTDNDPDTSNSSSEKMLPALGPQGTGRLKDMSLWGDQHRILQVIINLVSNSLKFTPEGGKVEVRIKCLGEAETVSDSNSRNSLGSKQSSQRNSRHRYRPDSTSNTSQISRKPSNSNPTGTALLINPMDPKATPRVQVRERSPTPPPRDAKTWIFQFEVQDTGPGIPLALQDKVFEPFVQADLGLSKKFGGTGLGLSICSQLATLMGGSITLDSIEGVGSTFTMKIPLKHTRSRAPSTSSSEVHGSKTGSLRNSIEGNRASSPKLGADGNPKASFDKDVQPRLVGLSQPFFATTPSAAASKVPSDSREQLAALDSVAATKEPGSKLRVLVAEDNLVNQEVVLRMLKLEDIYDVVVARDGQEAFDMVKESMSKNQYFDLIFMDIQMPNLDGLQSTRLIRKMGYSAPIVALTAFSEESNVKECYDSGMDMFLSKPIRRPALKQVLKKFATIPEEIETSSLTKTSTPPPESDAHNAEEKATLPPALQPIANGTPTP